VLSHFFVLVVAVRRAVLMSAIDVIGKRDINTGKAKQLYALARIVNLVSGTYASRAFSRYDSRFDISHIPLASKARSSGPRLPHLFDEVAAEVREAVPPGSTA
jgi:hypothetical protein